MRKMGIVYLVPGGNNGKDVIFVYPRPWLTVVEYTAVELFQNITRNDENPSTVVMMLPRVAISPNFDQQLPSLS